ncbi:C2H2 zinc finger [Ceratobasidium sp. AG-Ba]|nr:C2H2 zinc finger [Ceratobasidium sp. AG-Ba]
MSGKRRRQNSVASHDDVAADLPEEQHEDIPISDSKLPRASVDSANRSLACSLPPSCAPPRHPTVLGSLRELEAHYAKYHTHVCQEGVCHREPGGAKIFPDARLLALHQTEYHDEIAALKNERGEKILACFLESCPRKFRTPKGRRLHLISVHGYPKLYFFAVTKHGIGQLLARYGEGATLIRKEWKPRAGGSGDVKRESDDDSEDDASQQSDHSSLHDAVVEPKEALGSSPPQKSTPSPANPSQSADNVDELASSMKSLSLIPTSIRFGRGAKRAGFVRPGAARGGLSNVTAHTTSLRNRGKEPEGKP